MPEPVALEELKLATDLVGILKHPALKGEGAKPIRFPDVLKDQSLLRDWQKGIQLVYHPDKHGNSAESQKLFSDFTLFYGKLTAHDTTDFCETKELSLEHIYWVNAEGLPDKIATRAWNVRIPLVRQDIRELIHQYCDLTASEIERLDAAYDDILKQALKELLKLHPRDFLSNFYNPSEALKKEFKILTGQDPKWVDAFRDLQNCSFGYHTFDSDLDKRSDKFCGLSPLIFNNREFRRQLHFAYANLALRIKSPEDKAIRISMAKIVRDIIRLLPTLLIWSLFIIGIFILCYPLLLIMVWTQETIVLFTTFNTIITTISIVEWTLLWKAPNFLSNFFNSVEQNILDPLSNAIDGFVGALFSVKLHVLELNNFMPDIIVSLSGEQPPVSIEEPKVVEPQSMMAKLTDEELNLVSEGTYADSPALPNSPPSQSQEDAQQSEKSPRTSNLSNSGSRFFSRGDEVVADKDDKTRLSVPRYGSKDVDDVD